MSHADTALHFRNVEGNRKQGFYFDQKTNEREGIEVQVAVEFCFIGDRLADAFFLVYFLHDGFPYAQNLSSCFKNRRAAQNGCEPSSTSASIDIETAAERDLCGLFGRDTFADPASDDGHERARRKGDVEIEQGPAADAIFGQ